MLSASLEAIASRASNCRRIWVGRTDGWKRFFWSLLISSKAVRDRPYESMGILYPLAGYRIAYPHPASHLANEGVEKSPLQVSDNRLEITEKDVERARHLRTHRMAANNLTNLTKNTDL